MAGLNSVLSLSDDVARYLKACGKSGVLQTKPVNPSQLKGLRFAPEAIGETLIRSPQAKIFTDFSKKNSRSSKW